MKKAVKKIVAVASSIAIFASVGGGLVACDNDHTDVGPVDYKKGTYRITTSAMPVDWNVLSSGDANDGQIMDYIQSSFQTYDFKFDESKGGKYLANGQINAEAIVDGSYVVQYSAATSLDDVTATVDAKWGYTAAQKASGGYAWKITLRDDLKWDDGSAIDAADFVYSMKAQLDPDFKHRRASEYYNNQIKLINAREYLYGGDYGYSNMISAAFGDDEYIGLDAFTENASDGTLTYEGQDVLININDGGNWGDDGLKAYYDKLGSAAFGDGWPAIEAKADSKGYVHLTKADILVICDMIAVLHEYADAAEYAQAEGDYAYLEWEEFCYFGKSYDELDFDQVGIYAPSQYEIVICLSQAIKLKDDEGNLTYNAAYAMSSLPLVKEDVYESSKVAPGSGSSTDATLWTSTYCTDLASTPSWGPYKLTAFQSDKSYTLEKNPYWYGWNMPEYKNQYNVEKIECELISDVNTRWLQFLQGSTDSIGIDANHAEDYGRSKYAVYSPRVAMFSYNLFADLDVLKTNGRNNGILAIKDFRKAISLAMDRRDINVALTAANQPCYGCLDGSYYYDIENGYQLDDGGVYRNTPQAKKAILRAYGYTENEDGTWSNGGLVNGYSLEDAYETVNGYDLAQAKTLLESAYAELTANAEKYGYNASQNITILFGSDVNNEDTQKEKRYIQENVIDKLTAGTSLEGKIKVEFREFQDWGTAFQSGNYDLCTGGYGNAPFDPFYMISSYIEPSFTLTNFWDVTKHNITFKMPAGDYAGAGQELTMSLQDWYNCLNGTSSARYNWGAGYVDASVRLEVLAMIEEEILGQYYSIPYSSGVTSALLGAKFSYITNDYNTLMGFGGIRYLVVNYTDSEWTQFVSSNNSNLEALYKQTA